MVYVMRGIHGYTRARDGLQEHEKEGSPTFCNISLNVLLALQYSYSHKF